LTLVDIPVLCLDTCVILDIVRDSARKDVRIHEHESSLALLRAAQSGELEVPVASQASLEFRDHVEKVQQDARQNLKKRKRETDRLNSLAGLYGKSQPVALMHWNDHDKRIRETAECWLQVSTILHGIPDFPGIIKCDHAPASGFILPEPVNRKQGLLLHGRRGD